MSFPMDLDHCLALAPTDTPLVVRHIPFDSLRAVCADRGLTEGDAVRSLGTAGAQIVVQRADGARINVERRYALMIEVDPTTAA